VLAFAAVESTIHNPWAVVSGAEPPRLRFPLAAKPGAAAAGHLAVENRL